MTALEKRLDEIEARRKAATPGKWVPSLSSHFDEKYGCEIGYACGPSHQEPDVTCPNSQADARFIASAPTDVEFLLSALRVAMEGLDVNCVCSHLSTDPCSACEYLADLNRLAEGSDK